MTIQTEARVERTSYVRWSEKSWICGRPGQSFLFALTEPTTRVIDDYQLSHELADNGFYGLTPERLGNLPKNRWFNLRYDRETGARHLFCGYEPQ